MGRSRSQTRVKKARKRNIVRPLSGNDVIYHTKKQLEKEKEELRERIRTEDKKEKSRRASIRAIAVRDS